MKKIIPLLCCLLLGLLVGCADGTSSSPSSSSPELPAESSSSEAPAAPSQSLPESLPEQEQEPSIMVADASMYRGTVTVAQLVEDGMRLTLEQAKGTDFGAASIEALLPQDAVLSFSPHEIVEGSYLEIYYSGSLEAQPVRVIAANLYPSAEMVNFNGVFEELRTDSPDAGSLVLRDVENGQQVVYHYAAEQTQLYVDLSSLVPGDQLNIFHRGVYTMSLPPQGSALEIRKIKESLPVADPAADSLQTPVAGG